MPAYQNVLVPTDGSKLAKKAIQAAVRLASSLGARLTGVYIVPAHYTPFYTEGAAYLTGVLAEQHREAAKKEGQKALAVIESAARKAGLRYGSVLLASTSPWEGILKAAKAKRCDLIVMASHGRRGLSGLLIGSETSKVLTHSKIPVLVCR